MGRVIASNFWVASGHPGMVSGTKIFAVVGWGPENLHFLGEARRVEGVGKVWCGQLGMQND